MMTREDFDLRRFGPTIFQAVLIAALTAVATGYVSAAVVQKEVQFLRESIERLDKDQRALNTKVIEIEIRQARVISQANTIHDNQDKRMDRLEKR